MKRLTNHAVPYQATLFSAAALLFTVVLNYVMPESVFIMITSISTFCFIYILGHHRRMPSQISQAKTRTSEAIFFQNATVPIHELPDPSVLPIYLGGTSITK